MGELPYSNSGDPGWLMMRLCRVARQTDTASDLALEGLALEPLAALSRGQSTVADVKIPRWLAQTEEILHACFPKAMTHNELAKAVGVHPVHLASMFRKYFQSTIGEHVRSLRIDYASRQLAGSVASLADIALAAGFDDQSHFSKVFKRITGTTPAQFRGNLRKS
jgi:AraC family transcriptional regulator